MIGSRLFKGINKQTLFVCKSNYYRKNVSLYM